MELKFGKLNSRKMAENSMKSIWKFIKWQQNNQIFKRQKKKKIEAESLNNWKVKWPRNLNHIISGGESIGRKFIAEFQKAELQMPKKIKSAEN